MAQNKTESDVISYTQNLFAKLPPMPPNARQTLVNVMPWLALIFGILGVLATVSAFGLLAFFTPFMLLGGVHMTGLAWVGVILGFVGSVLLLAAYPGTKARKYSGWRLLFWSEAVSVISAVLSFNLVSVLIAAIGLYLLFQIKSFYK